MKIPFPFICGCCICALILGTFTLSVAARNKAEITDVYLDQEKKNLEVSFRIVNCFTPEMEEAVLSGVETTFQILLVLEKTGFPLFRQKLVNVVLDHTIKYDRINNEFQVILSEQMQKVLITTDFDEAKQWMSRVDELSLIPIWRLEKGSEYRLKLKAELSKVRLPLFFRYIFYFVSLWDFETSWREITFAVK